MMRKIHIFAWIILSFAGMSCCSSGGIKDDFSAAIDSGSIDKVRVMLSEHPSLRDAYLNDGWTALTIAAREGNVGMVNLLIDQGSDVNQLEGGGNSALFWAVYYGHEEVVSILLRRQARIDNKCRECRDPVEIAREKNFDGILKLLDEYKHMK